MFGRLSRHHRQPKEESRRRLRRRRILLKSEDEDEVRYLVAGNYACQVIYGILSRILRWVRNTIYSYIGK